MLAYDALNYLPRTRVIEFPKGFVLYEPGRPSPHLSLVLAGRVKVCSTADDGSSIILRIAGPEEFVGESALIPPQTRARESAVVLDCAQTMNWDAEELSRHIASEPHLGLALFRYFGGCNRKLVGRLAAQFSYRCPERVMLALTELARQLGSQQPDGSMRISGLTHHAIAEYVCTSREIVTAEMNNLRRHGYVTYSRRHIDVFVEPLTDKLREEQISVGESLPSMRVAS